MDNHCYDIHHNLALEYMNGNMYIAPCCHAASIKVEESTITEYWNNPKLIQLRQENLSGKLSEHYCHLCIKHEYTGTKSRRQKQVEFYQSWNGSGLRTLEIKLGNLCNLKCTICNPEFSTAWIADAKAIGRSVEQYVYYDKKFKFEITDSQALQNLEMVHFYGGEPLIDDKHVKVLEFLDQCDILKNCRITYNTNATQRVTDQTLELWAKAKLVEIYFSIDDIGDRFEYERFLAKWDQVQDNLKWYQQTMPNNHLFYITCAISYLNICYLPELIEWKRANFDTNRLGDFIKMDFQLANGSCAIKGVSPELKQCLAQEFAEYPEILSFLTSFDVVDNYYPVEVIEFIQQLDKLRNTDWRTTFSKLYTQLATSTVRNK